MNEKLQYATMLEIPVSTCNVTFQQTKKKRTRTKKQQNPDAVKEKLLSKINAEKEEIAPVQERMVEMAADTAVEERAEEQTYYPAPIDDGQVEIKEEISKNKKWRIKSFKVSVIGIQLAVIAVLVATIFLTNAFYADSGINMFMRQVFGADEQTVETDTRSYQEFLPVIALDDQMSTSLADGVINIAGAGSVYSPCDGKVSAVFKGEDGKYTVEISHSENFKTTLSGLDFAYSGLEEKVFANIPVGYVSGEGASMCFTTSDGTVISNYEIVDNSVVWAA